LVLILPVGLGQLCRAWPRLARRIDRHRTANGVLSRLLVFAVLMRAAVDVPAHADRLSLPVMLLTVLVCAAVHLGGLFAGLGSARALGCDHADAVAVAIGGSQKSLPVGLYLYQTWLAADYPLAALPLVFYHVLQLVLDTFVAEALAPASKPLTPDLP
jgi:predicted Na+-dependent transporter